MKWYLKVLGDWADFRGRASRQEYWWFVLFNVIFTTVAEVIDNLLGIEIYRIEDDSIGPVALVYGLALLLPSLAVGVRRMHDVGKSGWFLLAPLGLLVAGILLVFLLGTFLGESFVVLTGILMVLVIVGILVWFITVLATPGMPGQNKWGPNPNETAASKSL